MLNIYTISFHLAFLLEITNSAPKYIESYNVQTSKELHCDLEHRFSIYDQMANKVKAHNLIQIMCKRTGEGGGAAIRDDVMLPD